MATAINRAQALTSSQVEDNTSYPEIVRNFLWETQLNIPPPTSVEGEQDLLQQEFISEIYKFELDRMSQRLITQSNSRLTKENVAAILTKEEAWSSLDEETQQELYRLIPAEFRKQQYQHDHTVHPMKTQFAKYIKHFIYEWEQDLANGFNTVRWNEEAKLASGERAASAFDEGKEREREQFWGQKYDPNHFRNGSTTVSNTSVAGESDVAIPITAHDSAMDL